MRAVSVAFLAAMLTSTALTPLVRSLARRFGFLDHALSSRKIHGKPIPRLGGVAIVCGFFAPLAALYFVDSEVGRRFWLDPRHALGLFAGGLLIAALGVLDDIWGSGARIKFAVQFGVAALMYALGFRIDHLASPFGPAIDLGFLALPFTMLWIAGVVNAMNLIDGLDGLAGGVALIAVASTFGVAFVRYDPLMMLFTAALAGSVLGFLFYNFNPATIFMGDTGSMFLGFVLATTGIQTNQKSSTAVALVVPIIALGVPIADTLLAMVRRAARGMPLFSADRGHIHHRLLALGLSQRQAVIVLYGVCILLGVAALALSTAGPGQAAAFLAVISIVGVAALWKLGYFHLENAERILEERRRNLELRSAVREVGSALRVARSEPDIWRALRQGAQAVGATGVWIRDASRDTIPPHPGPAPVMLRAAFSIAGEHPGARHLLLRWDDGRAEVGRDIEIAVEALCAELSDALTRVEVSSTGRYPIQRTGSA